MSPTRGFAGEGAGLPDRSGTAQPFLEAAGLGKRFGATVALHEVCMAFHSGQIHCLLGENGAGKSTVGKIIGGVYAPDSGHILIDGRKVEIGAVTRARRLGIAVVFQELSLALDLSVRANLLLGIEAPRHPFARLRSRAERARVRAVLDALELDVGTEQRVGDLPLAHQQMIEVAKALIRQPRMIVLDEPTAMLNEPEKRRLFKVLEGLRERGTALAFITHHMEDVRALADHVSIMRDGRLVDSFSLASSPDAGAILEKLSGTGSPARRPPSRHRSDQAVVSIGGLRDRAGSPADLELAAGEIVGLYGVAGCGAEQIARVLVGLRHRAGIAARMHGARINIRTPAHARRLGIAYVPTGRARHGILPGRSIRENLNLSQLRRYARWGVLSRRREAHGTHAQLQANAVKFASAEDNITALSGGNQQKVLMGRAIAAASKVLVLEDPTAGIDVAAKRQIHESIRARAAEGITVVLISSDLTETIDLVDTLYTMYAGAIVHRYASPRAEDRAAIVADVIGQEPVPANHAAGASVPAEERTQ